jgi:hypothetical protein
MVDHVTKAGQGRYAFGSERKISGLDGAALKSTCKTPFGKGQTGRTQLHISKDRPGGLEFVGTKRHVADLEILSTVLEGGGYAITYTLSPPAHGATFQPTWYMQRLSEELENALPNVLKWGELKQAVTGTDEYKRQALGLLVDGEYISLDEVGKAKLYRSLKPYRAPSAAGNITNIGKARDLGHAAGDYD